MPSFKDKALNYLGYDPEVHEAVSVRDYAEEHIFFGWQDVKHYIQRLFPFTRWILHYNVTWLLGDLIAGITVGMVVVPQGMSYAKIATLSPEYGLYSSFVGVLIYAIFATSKDVTIGPVAVMSLEVSKVIANVQAKPGGELYDGPTIATALAFICGFTVLGIGLLRLGWLVEFIPAPAVSGFMTGSAINIASGQVPGLMGYSSKMNTRASTYKVIINSFKHLPDTTRDAAFGLFGLVFLYGVRYGLNRVERTARNPRIRRAAFFGATLRTAVVIIFETLFSWVYLRHLDKANKSHWPISVLGKVPSGFKHMGRPKDIGAPLLSLMASELPVSIIVLLLEHIAISKSFGRVNNYKIDPNQELIAIGVSNTIGTLFNAYPATGSFSRSAIKSKAGVRTPLAGWFTGIVVIIAIYGLTTTFYWIPNAALAAVIIHAVGDLIASPKQVYSFWKVSPLEAVIWFAAVLVSVFATIDIGIYVSVAASAALLLYRIARPKGKFLGRVRLVPSDDAEDPDKPGVPPLDIAPSLVVGPEGVVWREVYVPLEPDRLVNSRVHIEPPPPGVIIYRFDEAFLYLNASYYADEILDYAKEHTQPGTFMENVSQGDRPWNDPGPSKWGKRNGKSFTLRKRAQGDSEIQNSQPKRTGRLFGRRRNDNAEGLARIASVGAAGAADIPELADPQHRVDLEAGPDDRDPKVDEIDLDGGLTKETFSKTTSTSSDDFVPRGSDLPRLKALVLDFSSVSNIDTTSVQNLVDLRRVLERYAGQPVEFHFATILSPWIKRALLAGGFGSIRMANERPLEIAAVVPSGTENVASYPHAPEASTSASPQEGVWETKNADGTTTPPKRHNEIGAGIVHSGLHPEAPVLNRTFQRFHLDLPSAVAAATLAQDRVRD